MGLVGVEQDGLLDVEDHLVFQRRDGTTRFTDGFVEHARAQLQIEQLDNEFTDACPRQTHPQRQEHDGAGQARPDQAPLSERHLVPEWSWGAT
nr:hypothetical protein [Massilia aquatica]